MTDEQLYQAILHSFTDVYCVNYIGKLKINKLQPIGYDVEIGIPNEYHPLHIMAELDADEFIPFFREELRSRRLDFNKYEYASKIV